MFTVVADHVFPFLRTLGGDDSTYAYHMKDARFTIPTPALLSKVVDLIDHVPMEDRDTKGDLYEYMLSKIASAGQNEQFRTPRHIIRLMVEMTAPTPKDVICDPACGACGFLVTAAEYLRERHPESLRDAALREHFHHGMFHEFDFDNTMLRIGSMNMLLHGVESPDVRYRDSLAQDHSGEDEKYTLVLANPPFAGSLDYETVAKDLLSVVKAKKTELLFLALFLRLLKPGGRSAVIVPDGVLFGSSNAHKELRRVPVEDQKLDAVVSLPSGVFRPYAGVSTAILFFTKTNSGGTDFVWFYDVEADGWILDDKRQQLLDDDKVGPVRQQPLSEASLSGGYKIHIDRDTGKQVSAGYDWSESIFADESTRHLKAVIWFDLGDYESRRILMNPFFGTPRGSAQHGVDSWWRRRTVPGQAYASLTTVSCNVTVSM